MAEERKAPKTKENYQPTMFVAGSLAFDKQYEENKKKSKLKSLLINLLFIGLNIFAILYVILSEEKAGEHVASIWEVIRNVSQHIEWLGLALLCYVAVATIDTVGYNNIIYHITGRKRLGTAFRVGAMGRYYDNITPFASGGQPFQIYTLMKDGLSSNDAMSVVIGRFIFKQLVWCLTIFVVFLLAPIICPSFVVADWIQTAAYIGLALWAFIPLAVILLSFNRRIMIRIIVLGVKLLAKMHIVKDFAKTLTDTVAKVNLYQKSMKTVAQNKSVLILQILLIILEAVVTFSVPYLVFRAFGGYEYMGLDQLNVWLNLALSYMYCQCAVSFIPTPGTAGAAEISFKAVFARVFTYVAGGSSMLFWGLLTWRYVTFYAYIVMGVLILLWGGIRKWVNGEQS